MATDTAPEGMLQTARLAAEHRSWVEALEAYTTVDRGQPLEPEDLDQLAKAAWWTGRPNESIAAHERAYAKYVERGDVERAAFVALTLRREHAVKLDTSSANGWLARAVRLLANRPDSPSHGYLAIAHGELAWHRGEFDHALEHLDRAMEVASGSDDPDLQAWALMRRGQILIARGELEEGWSLLEEVSVAAVGSELGPYTTGAAFCNVIETSRELADFAAAAIRRSLDDTTWDKLARARLLPAAVEIARAGGDSDAVAQAADELRTIAAEYPTPAVRASAELAKGTLELMRGAPGGAVGRLRRAGQLWREVDAPYEAARTQLVLAEALAADGDADGSTLELDTARATFERLGAVLDARTSTERLDALRRHATEGAVARRTFLFTDIVGSTALLEAIGDNAWSDLRRWHDETLRRCVAHEGGEDVDHTGDGFFVSFPDSASAVACAREIQRKLADHRRDHGFAPQIRIGLHAAEATKLGANYTGIGVHTAARIGAIAGAGEIVVSTNSINGLDELEVSDRRMVDLKGIAGPIEVVCIDWV